MAADGNFVSEAATIPAGLGREKFLPVTRHALLDYNVATLAKALGARSP